MKKKLWRHREGREGGQQKTKRGRERSREERERDETSVKNIEGEKIGEEMKRKKNPFVDLICLLIPRIEWFSFALKYITEICVCQNTWNQIVALLMLYNSKVHQSDSINVQFSYRHAFLHIFQIITIHIVHSDNFLLCQFE